MRGSLDVAVNGLRVNRGGVVRCVCVWGGSMVTTVVSINDVDACVKFILTYRTSFVVRYLSGAVLGDLF